MPKEDFEAWKKATSKDCLAIVRDIDGVKACYMDSFDKNYRRNMPKHIGTWNPETEELVCDDVSMFGHVNESAELGLNPEIAYNKWFEQFAPTYDVSNEDAYYAGAKVWHCDADASDYENWLKQFAPNYDVSNYDAFEGGFYDAYDFTNECEEGECDYHHPNAGIYDCSCCGSPENTNILESFLINDGYDVNGACDILNMDPAEIVCEECYKSLRSELDAKLNDLETYARTESEWGKYEESKKPSNVFGKEVRYLSSRKVEEQIDDFTPKASTSKWRGKKSFTEGREVYFTNHIGERDSFYDPSAPEKSLADLDAEAGSGDSYVKINWLARFEKGIDYTTKEGLENAANKWENTYFSDLVHDIKHDGDYQGSKECEAALSTFRSKIVKGAEALGITSAEANGALKSIIQDIEKRAKNKQIAAKRAATKQANQANRLADYQQKALATTNETLRALLNDDGTLKARNSWGTIKDYLNTDEGKIFKNLWVNQFK